MQQISALHLVIGLEDKFMGSALGSKSFWTQAAAKAREENNMEFGPLGSGLRKVINELCRTRCEAKAAGASVPATDALSRAIDSWNDIVMRREDKHAAEREANWLGKRWSSVPTHIREQAQRRLSTDLATLVNMTASVDELEAASSRIAVLLAPEPPQLIQRYSDRVIKHLEDLRQQREVVQDTTEVG
jgi:hypothetical protein